MKKVIVYIDGFNLYHSIDDLRKPHLKWLDVVAMGNTFLRPGEILHAVKYFSAYATWMPDRYKRHREYVAAIEERGAIIHMGQFKEKPRQCRSCGARWKGHEEKETDVQIAVHMVADAFKGDVQRMIAANAPECEVFVAAPPMRMKFCRSLQPKLEITPGRLSSCLLPPVLRDLRGRQVNRPLSYDPPV